MHHPNEAGIGSHLYYLNPSRTLREKQITKISTNVSNVCKASGLGEEATGAAIRESLARANVLINAKKRCTRRKAVRIVLQQALKKWSPPDDCGAFHD